MAAYIAIKLQEGLEFVVGLEDGVADQTQQEHLVHGNRLLERCQVLAVI
jgi:type II secretory pathway component PulL